jgi:hypothetical protein
MLSIAHLVGCSRRQELAEIFDGTNNVQLIRSARVITAWRTAAWFKGRDRSPDDLFQMAGEPVVLPADLSAELTKVLLDKKSYLSGSAGKASVAIPIVVISLSDSSRTLELFFSFSDDSLLMKPDRATPTGTPGWVTGDFQPSRGKLLRIVKQIFSSDRRMQALNETRADGSIWPKTWQGE